MKKKNLFFKAVVTSLIQQHYKTDFGCLEITFINLTLNWNVKEQLQTCMWFRSVGFHWEMHSIRIINVENPV